MPIYTQIPAERLRRQKKLRMEYLKAVDALAAAQAELQASLAGGSLLDRVLPFLPRAQGRNDRIIEAKARVEASEGALEKRRRDLDKGHDDILPEVASACAEDPEYLKAIRLKEQISNLKMVVAQINHHSGALLRRVGLARNTMSSNYDRATNCFSSSAKEAFRQVEAAAKEYLKIIDQSQSLRRKVEAMADGRFEGLTIPKTADGTNIAKLVDLDGKAFPEVYGRLETVAGELEEAAQATEGDSELQILKEEYEAKMRAFLLERLEKLEETVTVEVG